MRIKVIGYWVTTTLIGLETLAGGITDPAHGRTSLVSGPFVVDIITHLGYPVYFLTILGVWKLLGGITLFAPGLPRLKEWAYAGIVREELVEDYRRMIYAETRTTVDQARARVLKKWRMHCPAVIECLEEAGEDLFTFLRFPKLQWKALRTNALERINEEFRRRTKTQASWPSQDAVPLLLKSSQRATSAMMLRRRGAVE